ncbi:related to aldehyde dehydrogenase [Phialocephala subalpina]|uniref:Related to aldehyde dehydrogenase n=1 Tax=Phialocephala subalpina TaxID=576137 RepID=A0A1L7XPL5_9HELO|nr:related to aldehyde dehydrogenase [Phialocephala subalpina]
MGDTTLPQHTCNSVPLIIDGEEFRPDGTEYTFFADNFGKHLTQSYEIPIHGADVKSCNLAVDSCARAFTSWRESSPHHKRHLFHKTVTLLREREVEIRSIMEQEINCTPTWSHINFEDSIRIIEEAAALVTSPTLGGIIPPATSVKSQALVFIEPLGVIIGIAPWNSPLILGLRAVVAPIAAGNTAILKGSELSPRTHYFVARLFKDAGFPPGVLNFLVHREQDGPEIFKTLIERPEVRKCNFTGSTPVGRILASQAARSLKPMLLELGGKNFAVVMKDADLDQAARLVVEGAFLNNGQICMSTDIVLVDKSILSDFKGKVLALVQDPVSAPPITPVINSKSATRIRQLLSDAEAKGAKVTKVPQPASQQTTFDASQIIPATIIEDITPSMAFYSQEGFGPLLGILPFSTPEEAAAVISSCPYGLSASIFTQNHFAALKFGRSLRVGAIHINGATVHDGSTLPHGGHGDSGWGRFGASWGLQEFVQTKTMILNE